MFPPLPETHEWSVLCHVSVSHLQNNIRKMLKTINKTFLLTDSLNDTNTTLKM